MSITLTPVANTNTFGDWLQLTNDLVTVLGSNTVTADASTTGSVTTGNTTINGYFFANTIVVGTALRGGTLTTSANLVVSSNGNFNSRLRVNGAFTAVNTAAFTSTVTFSNTVSITGAVTLSKTIAVTGAATFSNTLALTGAATFSNTLAVTGNITASANLAVSGNVVITGDLSVGGSFVLPPGLSSNTIGVYYGDFSSNSSTFASASPQTIDSFAIATYRSVEYIAQVSNATTYQVSKIIGIHDGSTGYISEYGSIYTGGVLGTFSGGVSGGVFSLTFTPTDATSKTVKVLKTMVKV